MERVAPVHPGHLGLPRSLSGSVPTRVYIQKDDGHVYHGVLTPHGQKIPIWVRDDNRGNDEPERVFVRMPNHDSLVAIVEKWISNPSDDYKVLPQHRIFILHDDVSVYVANLYDNNEFHPEITSPILVVVRMPDENNARYVGGFEHFREHRPPWLI